MTGEANSWRWCASSEGSFSTKSAYALVKASRIIANQTSINKESIKQVWATPAPQKARVTSWRLLRNKLPTCDNLRKRNIQLGEEEAMCNACCQHYESTVHTFIECPKTEKVWTGIQNWLGISGPRPQDIAAHFDAFANLGRKRNRIFLRALWMCTTWILWKSRNESRFEGRPWKIENLIRDIKVRVWSWNKVFKLLDWNCNFSSWMTGDMFMF
ncbi:uncharacterized protein LOC131019040 [Salvia miltiorrhiza]|uniref:uncharacterized protein LOC131019040 n=1 Tax=Salvia miltiorrhiza TaxID=226208 RepID=UPI0025ACCD30|nr:uncharacterized protein LOC131019040 [Salvia miltiorrhiza]